MVVELNQSGEPPLLALTLGDPAGIGPEITLKVWQAAAAAPSPPPYRIVVLGDPAVLALYAARAGIPDPGAEVEQLGEIRGLWPARLPIRPVRLARAVVPGRPDPANASGVIAAIEQATELAATGGAAALVTNPIAKAVLYAAGFRHPGHTEFLGELASRFLGGGPYRPVMMLASEELRVVPLTVHIPLNDVPKALTQDALRETAVTVVDALARDFAIFGTPRIAVAGLNPHAGEGGTMGREEQAVISPAIASLRAEGYAITGPFSADTLFHEDARATYDAVIAMYHDQALIPIKTLAFDRAVNATLGLPFIRTSPDHGTAFDIAGKGQARATSLAEALSLAARLARNRRSYEQVASKAGASEGEGDARRR